MLQTVSMAEAIMEVTKLKSDDKLRISFKNKKFMSIPKDQHAG
jgi:hypothetical protein